MWGGRQPATGDAERRAGAEEADSKIVRRATDTDEERVDPPRVGEETPRTIAGEAGWRELKVRRRELNDIGMTRFGMRYTSTTDPTSHSIGEVGSA